MRTGITAAAIWMLLSGFSIFLYPAIREAAAQSEQVYVIAEYQKAVRKLPESVCELFWEQAEGYNRTLAEGQSAHSLPDARGAVKTEMIGYLEIPKICCLLPIYPGEEEAVLRKGAGYLTWSSFPVGGGSTHTVLSGHRGLPEAKLFTDLDKLELGDTFCLTVLDESMTYQVEKIEIVEPWQGESLMIREGEDLCTLVTCTPYGINSHRLLVQGRRAEELTNSPEEIQ